ncbi:MAG: DUF3267 domain-containing protein [Bacteroidales bacterium]
MEIIKSDIKEISLDVRKDFPYFAVSIIPLLFITILFFLLKGKTIFSQLRFILIDRIYIDLLILITGIAIHEFLHGLSWMLCTNKGIKSVRFGINRKNFSPYCHFTEPIMLKHYITGGISPAILLGFAPLVVSFLNGNAGIFLFGLVFTIGALSDLAICIKLIKENKNSWVYDHPDKTGCFITKNKINLNPVIESYKKKDQ